MKAPAFPILAFAICIAFLLSGCVENPPSGIFSEAVFTPLVDGCAETGEGVLARDDPGEMGPAITVDGNALIYNRKISHQCCRTAEITSEFLTGMDLSPDIIIYENWSGQGCRCMCSSELGARVDNLKEGFYNVRVIEKGVNADGSPMEEKRLMQKNIQIKKADATPLAISVEGTSFAKGEEINFSIANNSSQSVFLNGCNPFAVERKAKIGKAFSGGKWGIVDELLLRCVWEGIAQEIKAGEAREMKIDSVHANVLNTGTYRVSAFAGIGCTQGEPLSQANCSSELTANSAEFSITQPARTTIYYRGKQCELFPWSILCEQGCQVPEYIEVIKDYYQGNYGIEILDVSVDTYVSCEACFTCPSSEEFAAVVYEKDRQQMLSFGWKEQSSSE